MTLEPLLVIVCLLAGGLLIRRREAAPLVPFTVILLGLLVATHLRSPGLGSPTGRHRVARVAVAAGAALVLLAPDSPAAVRMHRRFENEHQIAAYLDAKRLPSQSVLVDVASGFAIVIASRRPESFVITTDRQFRAALYGVGDNHVQYILDVPNEARGLGTSNAVNVEYPSFYRDGGGVAVLDREFPQTSDQPPWRLYRVVPSPGPGEPAESGPVAGSGHLPAGEREVDRLSRAIERRPAGRS